jgi:hypothetical protein
MAAECGLVPARGETDAYANRYHERPVLSKQAGASPLDDLWSDELELATGPG